jgi:cobalt-zinc-cadmium efflux system outer membrane protein
MLRLCIGLIGAGCLTQCLFAQGAYTWQQIREKFEAQNPTLRAGEIGISESRAQEITAYLRPNPDVTATFDQIDPFTPNPYRPFTYALPLGSVTYLHERRHKRELRLESAKKATDIAVSNQTDRRTLLLACEMHCANVAGSPRWRWPMRTVTIACFGQLHRYKAGDIAEMD